MKLLLINGILAVVSDLEVQTLTWSEDGKVSPYPFCHVDWVDVACGPGMGKGPVIAGEEAVSAHARPFH
jgi:hypothetical protein